MWTLIKSYFACAYSAFTYIFQGMPSDKQSYWKKEDAPEYLTALAAYKKAPSFHLLKDVGVEWNKAWPQRGFKVTALFGCILTGVSWVIFMLVLAGLFLFYL